MAAPCSCCELQRFTRQKHEWKGRKHLHDHGDKRWIDVRVSSAGRVGKLALLIVIGKEGRARTALQQGRASCYKGSFRISGGEVRVSCAAD